MKLVSGILMLVLMSVGCYADGVTATVINVGADPLSNGTYYIGPYTLDIDGIDYAALCINSNVDSHLGVAYQATVLPLDSEALLEDAWLYEQINAPGVTDSQRENIQYAAWGINTAGAQAYETLAAENYGTVDAAEFDLVVPNDAQASQPFIVDVITDTPEPRLLALVGMLLISLFWFVRREKTTEQN